MLRIITMGNEQRKILRRRAIHKHRKMHIENAEHMRQLAKDYREKALESANRLFYGEQLAEIVETIEADYNVMMSEAIAEENSKCMDRSH